MKRCKTLAPVDAVTTINCITLFILFQNCDQIILFLDFVILIVTQDIILITFVPQSDPSISASLNENVMSNAI